MEFKYEQNDKEWEMHAEVKYYKILQSQKRKGGDKACIVLHIDRARDFYKAKVTKKFNNSLSFYLLHSKPKHCPLSLATLIN
jgi:hypothetical protein